MRGWEGAAALAALLRVALAQGDKLPEWKTDPYTKGEPEALAAAGYVSFGPFPWGDGHDSLQIEHVLGDSVKLLWVETAHFKIGSALPPYKLRKGDKEEKDKLAAELAVLKKRLPGVKTDVKELDRWLRLHLFARRFEDTYADFAHRMGVTDADFPAGPGQAVHGRYMGEGPYLGQPAKYTVLLLEKQSSVGQYLRTFLKSDRNSATRHNFLGCGSLLYVTSIDGAQGTLQIDTALHCEATFNVVHGLVDGYRYYTHSVPHWFRQGLAHCYLRTISPKYNVFREARRFDNDPEMLWNWGPRVRARASFDEFPRARDLLRWEEDDEQKIVDSMMVWSRVDFLLSLGDEKLRVFLDSMKGQLAGPHASPTREQILQRQDEALAEAWGLDAEQLDAQWKAWVLKTYPRR